MKATRSLAETRDDFLKKHGEACSVKDAERRIIAEFADGQRRAEGIPLPAGIEYEPISEALWQQAKKPASSTGLEQPWIRGVPVVTVDFAAATAIAQGGRGFTSVREILDPPAPQGQTSPKPHPTAIGPPRKNPGGRPPDYDWEQFWIWIVEIADRDGLPKRPALMRQLYDKMAAEWPAQPSESLVRQKLRRLYETLNLPEE